MAHTVESAVNSLRVAGRCPRLHVNALGEGVTCPDHIREQWQERLIIDLDSSYPLNLQCDANGISADLSFLAYVRRCTFPWNSIYVVADRATGRGIVFKENMPESVRASRPSPTTGPLPARSEMLAAARASGRSGTDAGAAPDEVERRRAAFRVIDGGT
ncbi:MAG: ClpXP protease specificity-enhancing factor SspB [Nannocystaceae bacterium]